MNNDFKRQLEEKEQELLIAKIKIARLEGELSLLHNSLSWKITAPLRRLGLRLPQLFRWVNRAYGNNPTPLSFATHSRIIGEPLSSVTPATSVSGSIGVHLHLYYLDLLDEMIRYLKSIPFDFSLYISISDENRTDEVLERTSSIEKARVRIIKAVPNRGRDVAPFVSTFAAELLQHDYICHIHGKKSLYTGSEKIAWRSYFLDSLTGSEETVRKIFGIFNMHPDLGLLYPETEQSVPYWAHAWLGSRQLGKQLSDRMGLPFDPSEYLDAPMGTMFWARTMAIKPLLQLALEYYDFPEESGQTDGTIAHAIERLLVSVAMSQGFTFCELHPFVKRFSIAFGSRNLSQYWQKNLDEMKSEILKYDVITFDIFDTLVARPLFKPESLFDLIALYAESQYGIKNFTTLRLEAEQLLRAETAVFSDPGIDTIYDKMLQIAKLKPATRDALCNKEKELEISFNSERRAVGEILAFAKKHGKRVLLLSDMYLDLQSVSKILEYNGISGFDEIHLSSEEGVRKDNATMWMKLLERFNRKSILHIGDNEHSDVQIPSDLGIAVYHLMSPCTLFLNSLLGRDFTTATPELSLADSAIVGMSVRKLFSSPFILHDSKGIFKFQELKELGYCVVGPVIFSYLIWLLQSVVEKRFHTVLFLAREGCLLKKLFDMTLRNDEISGILPLEISTHYLLASRRATTVPAISCLEDAKSLLRKNYNGSLHNLFESRYGIEKPMLASAGIQNRSIELPADIEYSESILMKLMTEILDNARSEKSAYLGYLKSLNLPFRPGGVAVCDLGYSGNIQRALSSIMGIPLEGYYFATSFEAIEHDKTGNRFYGYFTENDDQLLTTAPAYKHSLVLESMLTAPDGQLIRFIEKDGKVSPLYDSPNPMFPEIAKIHEGIETYCGDMLQHFGGAIMQFNPDRGVSQYLFDKVFSGQYYSKVIGDLLKVEDKYCSDGDSPAIL